MNIFYLDEDPVAAATYRAFYRAYKAGIARWAKGRSTPAWWQGDCALE